MANRTVASFFEHQEDAPGTPVGSAINFHRYVGPFKPKLVEEFRAIKQAGTNGTRKLPINTAEFEFTAEVTGDGKDFDIARNGIYVDLTAKLGKRGNLKILGITYPNVRLTNVRFVEPRGGTALDGVGGGQERTIVHEIVECDFTLEK